MEEVRNNFIVKTGKISIDKKEYGLFWGFNLGETIKDAKLKVDLKKITKQDFAEICKLIYCCILHYNKTAEALDIAYHKDIPTLGELTIFLELNPDKLTDALNYIVGQLGVSDKKKVEEKPKRKGILRFLLCRKM